MLYGERPQLTVDERTGFSPFAGSTGFHVKPASPTNISNCLCSGDTCPAADAGAKQIPCILFVQCVSAQLREEVSATMDLGARFQAVGVPGGAVPATPPSRTNSPMSRFSPLTIDALSGGKEHSPSSETTTAQVGRIHRSIAP